MLTKNFSVIFANSVASKARQVKAISGNLEEVSAAPSYTCNVGCFNNPVIKLSNEANKITLEVGTGNTHPTVNDFSLAEKCEQLTPISIISTYSSETYENASYCVNISKTFKNNTDSEITINEIALTASAISASNGVHSHNFIVCREVIEPVTLQPGDTYTFSIEIWL